jgi:chitodextrinase
MWGAAPQGTGVRLLLAAVVASSFAVMSAAPAGAQTSPRELPQVSAVYVERGVARSLGPRLVRTLARSGVNALMLDPSLARRDRSRAAGLARRRGLLVFMPLRERAPGTWATVLAANETCRSLKEADTRRRCTVLASSIVTARRLAEQPSVDLVVVRARSLGQARALATARGRVVAVPTLRTPARARPWRALARLAARQPSLDLAVRVAGDKREALTFYAAVVENTKGGDRKPPTAPTGLAVESASTALTLSWKPSKDNRGVTGYTLYRDGVEVGSTTGTTYTFEGLACGRAYALAVDAFDAAGNRSAKTALEAATKACSAAVYTLTPADGATISGSVRWEAGTDGAGIAKIEFVIDGAYRWAERNSPYVFNGNTGAWDTTKEADGLHTLALVATLEDGTVVGSSIVVNVANGGQKDTTPPSAPSSLVKSAGTPTSISLTWSESTDDVGVAGYRVYRDGSLVTSTSARTHSATGLVCGTPYVFGVEAYDASGNVSGRTTLSASTSACDTGATVYTVTPSAGSTVSGKVRWEAAASGATVARIEFLVDGVLRWTEANAPYVFDGNDGTWDTTVEPNGAHVLTLRLVTADGTTVSSGIGVTVANAADTSPPSAPSGLARTGATATSISLAWSSSSDDVGVAGYRVFRDGSPAGTTSATSFTIGGLACATTYGLAVEAYDAAGNTSGKAVVSAGTAACAPSSSTATIYLAPGGSDASPCTAAAPCKSFDRAYQAAQLGDVVELAAGTYAQQVMEAKNAKSPGVALADRVVFRPAPGATVETGPLEIRVPHVEFRDMKIAKFKARYHQPDPKLYAAGDLVFRNIRTHHFALNAVQHVSFIGGEVGPNRNPATGDWPQDGIFVGAYPADVHPASHLLFDGVYVHDVTEPTSTAHSDCVQFTVGIDVTIRNSRFENCEHADLMIKGDQGPIDGFVIENNFFDRTLSAFYSINLYETSRGCRDVLIRNNAALQNLRVDACTGGTLTGNIQPSMSSYTCSQATVTLDWNVYESGSKCGPNDVVGAVTYVDRSNFDLRLAGGSAVDRGNPASYPTKDIDGQARPKGGAPDAGAHEHS